MSARRPVRATLIRGEVVEHLNMLWRITEPLTKTNSLKQRLALPLRHLLARLLGKQEAFNSTVVQYVNAVQAADRQRADTLDDVVERMETAIDSAMRFHEALAARERRMEERERRMDEALAARERRMEGAMQAMRAEHDEIRTAVGVLQRARVTSEPRVHSPQSRVPSPDSPAPSPQSPAPSAYDMGSSYVGFEDAFRGSEENIRKNLASYLPIFAGASDVLDVGCGRGEFLRLLGEQGVSARGIDVNASMVDVCREHGLQAETADALGYLRAQPDASLGGLIAAQVVEHLEPGYLSQFIETAAAKLRPGAPIVLETINPACWLAFFESYVRDITHVRPLHPDTLKFLLVAAGFQRVDIQFRAPYPEHDKLLPVHGLPPDAVEALNANAAKLNSLLFTYFDYAAIGVAG